MKKSWLIAGAVIAVIVFALVLIYTNPGQKPTTPTPPETTSKPPETGMPQLHVAIDTLGFEGVQPPAQSFDIHNTGGGTLNWTAQADQPWVKLSTTEGSAPATVTVSIDPAGLTPGTHQAQITISAEGQPAKTIAVTLVFPTATTPKTEIKNPDTYVVVGIGDFIDTLDPAAAYDTGSGSIIFNVYETLIFFDGPHPDKFVPWLATEVPTIENGLIRNGGLSYAFPIRQNIKFHDGPVKDANGTEIPGSGVLTPEDVEYSFERGMLQDRAGGPQWLLLEPLLGVASIFDLAKQVEGELHGTSPDTINSIDDISPEGLQEVCQRVKATVGVEDGNAVFHLKEPFAPFLQILAGQWASILDREWVMTEIKDESGNKKAGWDGSCDTWRQFYDPPNEESELFRATNGTGPYILERWRREEELSLKIYKDYWRERPAYLNVNVKFNREWTTRLLQLQNGDADAVSILARNRDQVYPLVDQGLVVMYKDLPDQCLSFWMPNQKVDPENNPYIGSGQLDGNGIPSDFFSDLDIREAFAYAFDWDTYITEALEGDSVQARTIMIKEVFGYNPDVPYYRLDLEKATEHFKRAWGGQAWEKGFKLFMPHTPGGSRVALDILKQNLENINPKFKLEALEVQGTQQTQDFNNDKIPFDGSGWCQDYHDPHNWAYPLLGGTGYFGRFLDIEPSLQQQLDDLILQARRELDPEKRKELYYQIEQLNYDHALLIPIEQGVFKRFTRSWIKGFFWNMAYVGTYYWYLWKE
jgi:peptide/nickel transport system substrate-binding protein